MLVKQETSLTDNGPEPPFKCLVVDVRLEFHPDGKQLESVYVGDFHLSSDGCTWALYHHGEDISEGGKWIFEADGGLEEGFRQLLAALRAAERKG